MCSHKISFIQVVGLGSTLSIGIVTLQYIHVCQLLQCSYTQSTYTYTSYSSMHTHTIHICTRTVHICIRIRLTIRHATRLYLSVCIRSTICIRLYYLHYYVILIYDRLSTTYRYNMLLAVLHSSCNGYLIGGSSCIMYLANYRLV